tara:strand:- start:2047 stop:2283 length:237 start_codon:yes stop_codon:yes gene_type:complete
MTETITLVPMGRAEAEQLMHAVQNSMMEPKDLFGNKKDWESACNAIRSIAKSFGWNADAFMPEWDEEEGMDGEWEQSE